jgi:hypothetical protein
MPSFYECFVSVKVVDAYPVGYPCGTFGTALAFVNLVYIFKIIIVAVKPSEREKTAKTGTKSVDGTSAVLIEHFASGLIGDHHIGQYDVVDKPYFNDVFHKCFKVLTCGFA